MIFSLKIKNKNPKKEKKYIYFGIKKKVDFKKELFCKELTIPKYIDDISDENILIGILKKCKIDKDDYFKGTIDSKIKDELKVITKEAFDKEIFGAPTFVVNDKIFWGQDRLEFAIDEYNN